MSVATRWIAGSICIRDVVTPTPDGVVGRKLLADGRTTNDTVARVRSTTWAIISLDVVLLLSLPSVKKTTS